MRTLIKETKKRVNLRLEPRLIDKLHVLAEKENKPFQRMIREWLWEKIEKTGV